MSKAPKPIDNEETGATKLGLFDYVASLGETKRHLLDEDPENERGFNPFMTAVAFSQHLDTVLHANEANQYPGMSRRATYDFYFHGIPKVRRPRSWAKAQKVTEDIEVLARALRCSRKRAAECVGLVPRDELDALRVAYMDTGGLRKR